MLSEWPAWKDAVAGALRSHLARWLGVAALAVALVRCSRRLLRTCRFLHELAFAFFVAVISTARGAGPYYARPLSSGLGLARLGA